MGRNKLGGRRRSGTGSDARSGGRKTTRPDDVGAAETDAVADEAKAVALRAEFCRYLIDARERSGKTLDEIATKTRIPRRSLERLETGEFESLPADVFVRGFLRSYARYVGLDEADAIKRYAACGMTPAPVASAMADELASAMAAMAASDAPNVRAMPAPEMRRRTSELEAVTRPVERSGSAPVEVAPEVVERRPASEPSVSAAAPELEARQRESATEAGAGARAGKSRNARKRARKRNRGKGRGKGGASAAAREESAASEASAESEAGLAVEAVAASKSSRGESVEAGPAQPVSETVGSSETGPVAARSTQAGSESAAPSVLRAAVGLEAEPVRRPVMVIDDADPEAAERRREAERDDSTWKSFIPPVLLDTEQGSRRGALTLAVIILVIVATLTMSYLMRQPDESGDGVTFRGSVPGVIPSVIEAPRGSYDELS